jgi:hypothetical protein
MSQTAPESDIAIRGAIPARNTPLTDRRNNTSRSAMRKVNSVKAQFKRFHRAPPAEGFWVLK